MSTSRWRWLQVSTRPLRSTRRSLGQPLPIPGRADGQLRPGKLAAGVGDIPHACGTPSSTTCNSICSRRAGWSKTYLGINENELATTLAAIKVIKDHSKTVENYLCRRLACRARRRARRLLIRSRQGADDGRREGAIGEEASRPRTTSAAPRQCRIPSCSRLLPKDDGSAGTRRPTATTVSFDGPTTPGPPIRCRDARHVLWPAGDTFLVYPGGDSSIRFEKLREGIVDYEKIRLVRQQAAQSADTRRRTPDARTEPAPRRHCPRARVW